MFTTPVDAIIASFPPAVLFMNFDSLISTSPADEITPALLMKVVLTTVNFLPEFTVIVLPEVKTKWSNVTSAAMTKSVAVI